MECPSYPLYRAESCPSGLIFTGSSTRTDSRKPCDCELEGSPAQKPARLPLNSMTSLPISKRSRTLPSAHPEVVKEIAGIMKSARTDSDTFPIRERN